MNREQNELKGESVYEVLKKLILTHELSQGTPLSERKLSKTLDASRTPIREALKRLQREHFVEITPQYGALVARVTYNTILEVYETREVLEGLSAKLCAMSLNRNEKKELMQIYRDLRDALKEKRYEDSIQIDLDFHGFIVSHSHNIMLQEMVKTIFDHSRRITRMIDYTKEWSEAAQKQHYYIVRYIVTGQYDKAEKSMRTHIKAARERQLFQLKR